jgi:hypothetical protein
VSVRGARRLARGGTDDALEVIMGLLRRGFEHQVANLDHELEAAISKMRTTADLDQRRELLRRRIDELLDRRLQLQQELTVEAHEQLISVP